jgi:hypothetical protein
MENQISGNGFSYISFGILKVVFPKNPSKSEALVQDS